MESTINPTLGAIQQILDFPDKSTTVKNGDFIFRVEYVQVYTDDEIKAQRGDKINSEKDYNSAVKARYGAPIVFD